jgi:hypothetical protein
MFVKVKVIIVVDDEDRENEGIFLPLLKVTPEMINFMATHGRGLICAPLNRVVRVGVACWLAIIPINGNCFYGICRFKGMGFHRNIFCRSDCDGCFSGYDCCPVISFL